jgi:hypothetical protein
MTGLKASIEREAGAARRDHPWPDVAVFKHYGTRGLEVKHPTACAPTTTAARKRSISRSMQPWRGAPARLRYGRQAGSPSHFFGEHPDEIRSRCWEPYTRFRPCFDTMKPGLQAAGVEVINCSRETVLKTFPRMALADALRVAVAA